MSATSAGSYISAGAVAGMVEAIAVHPLDMIKTRHQLNVGRNQSVLATGRSLMREGGVSRLYRGLVPEVLGMMPKSSAMYATYDVSRCKLGKKVHFATTSIWFSADLWDRDWIRKTSIRDECLIAGLAGIAAGGPEALLATPFQVVKVKLQAKENIGRYRGPADCLLKVLSAEGVSGIFRGLGTTIWRNSVWNGIYFGAMQQIREKLIDPEDQRLKALQTAGVGFFAALLATAANAPFDVIKSRVQAAQAPGNMNGTFRLLIHVWREEGILACYKGFAPKALRMAIGGAVGIASYEFVLQSSAATPDAS